MTERPILMSAPMVRACLREIDPKTQTRRVVTGLALQFLDQFVPEFVHDAGNDLSPYGYAGDRLWVRETFAGERAHGFIYRADGKHEGEDSLGWRWRPSIHMPRNACRLMLDVTAVRIERLQDISIADVDAEGLDCYSATTVLTRAEKITAKPEHWISGYDEGVSFCRACAEKKIAELTAAHPTEEYTLDGGWRTESDSQAFCDTCECYLDSGFTDYCCESELDHFETSGFDVHNPSDCHSLDNIITASLWTGGKHSDRMRRLCYRALWDSLNEKRGHGWATNPWVWVIEFRRANG